MNDNKQVGFQIRGVLLECLSSTTFHGISNISKRNSHISLKIIWISCLLACSGYCCYYCSRIFLNYYSYPFTTKISIFHETPTDFPAISFCNTKLLNRSNPLTFKLINETSALNQVEDQYRLRFSFANIENLTSNTRKEFGFKLENMLLPSNKIGKQWCFFNNEFCDVSDFTYFYNPSYGNCYSFNIGYYDNGTKYRIQKSLTNDKNYGFNLELFIGDPAVDTLQESSDGIIMSIHNQSIAPFSKGSIILISPSSDTDIIINRNFLSKLPQPHGYCLEDTSLTSKYNSPYFDYIVRTLNQIYSQEYCYNLCLQAQTIRYCACSNVQLPVYLNTTRFCSSINLTEYACVWKIVPLYEKEFANHCKTSCPFECYSIDYIITSSRQLYPTKYRLDQLLYKFNYTHRITDKQLSKDAFLRFNIYYQGMQYTKIDEVASMSQEDLLSSFGGTLGLFLGI